MRIDLHCHTRYSSDSLSTFDGLLRWMDRRGLDMVAITDHNSITGALKFHAHAPGRFLVGEEIATTDGELIGLFLVEEVPPGLSLQETVDRVHAQGGLVGASHPLDRLRGTAMGREMLEAIREQLDFLEVYNARTTFPEDNDLAQELAIRWGLPGSAGSDAHAPFEVGRAYVEMPPFELSYSQGSDHAQSFLRSLSQGETVGRLSSPLIHLVSNYAKLRNRLGVR
jgi:predicted metal-dependent phosphoesterase TrpH